MHLIKKIANTAQEMVYLGQHIKKANLEIEALECQSEVDVRSQVNYVNCWNNIKTLNVAFVFVGNKEDQMKCE